jgi:hypothetical protein
MKLVIYTAILLYEFMWIQWPSSGGVTMVTRRLSSRVRRNARQAKIQSVEHVYGVPVPEALHEAIETERDNLSKAESLLACMVVSMEYENDSLTGPYYPAVAQVARELVERSINGLDPFILRQRLLRNKIEEVFCMSFVDESYPLLHQASSRQAIGSRLNG